MKHVKFHENHKRELISNVSLEGMFISNIRRRVMLT